MRIEILSQLFRPRLNRFTVDLRPVRDVVLSDDVTPELGFESGVRAWTESGIRLFVHAVEMGGRTALATAMVGGDGVVRTSVSLHGCLDDAGLHVRAIAAGGPVVLVCSSRSLARQFGLVVRSRVDAGELNGFASIVDGAEGVSWSDELSVLRQAIDKNDEAAWLTWSETVRLDLAALVAAGPHSLRIH